MVRKYKPVNRPLGICRRGPYRRKRDHIEDMKRWDCRYYIEQAVPDVDDDWFEDEDEDEEPMPVMEGWAEIDPRNPQYTIFKVEVELKPEHFQTLPMYRGQPYPNTPRSQKTHWWFWLCPNCTRQCRYLYTLGQSIAIQCRKCWNLPYRSQSKSHAQYKRERIAKWKPYMMSYYVGGYGDRYWCKDGREICDIPPLPPPKWIPEDLLKLYHRNIKSLTKSQGCADK